MYMTTDDQRIFDHVSNFGGKAIMTSKNLVSGTDRIKECFEKIESNADFIINIQGDDLL